MLLSTNRQGIKNVIKYLDNKRFYETPSAHFSRQRHHNWRGGLAEHCLGVYKIASINKSLPRDSIIIAGLLHDICKASLLYYDSRGHLHNHNPHIKGHGYRSIKILEMLGLKMTYEERLAIRWHMGGHYVKHWEQAEANYARNNELCKLIHYADKKDASLNPPRNKEEIRKDIYKT